MIGEAHHAQVGGGPRRGDRGRGNDKLIVLYDHVNSCKLLVIRVFSLRSDLLAAGQRLSPTSCHLGYMVVSRSLLTIAASLSFL